MKLKAILTISLLTFCSLTFAESSLGREAYEVALSEVRLPGAASGTISFRECDDCEYHTVRVSASTQWRLNGRAVTLEQFREDTAQVTNRRNEAVSIIHDLKSNRVTVVSVYL